MSQPIRKMYPPAPALNLVRKWKRRQQLSRFPTTSSNRPIKSEPRSATIATSTNDFDPFQFLNLSDDEKENCPPTAPVYNIPASTIITPVITRSASTFTDDDSSSGDIGLRPVYSSSQVEIVELSEPPGDQDVDDPMCIAHGYEYLVEERDDQGELIEVYIQNIWLMQQPGYQLMFYGPNVEPSQDVEFDNAIMVEMNGEEEASLVI